MLNVGIDLGTSFSFIGHLNHGRLPTLLPDASDRARYATPSVVHIGPDGCLVGQAAEDLLAIDPRTAVARFTKLHLGSGAASYIDPQGQAWTPEAISALILRKLKRDAERHTNEKIHSAVISIPARFGDAERRATMEAAQMADLPVKTLVEEPVAAAIYYGLSRSQEDQTLLVYDLGGGTFDATLLQASPEGLFVLATDGCRNVGGKRFDEEIAGGLFPQVAASDFASVDSPATKLQFQQFAEKVKIELSQSGTENVRKTLLVAGRACELILTRKQLEAMLVSLVDETLEACRRCLAAAALDWPDVDKVLLTGGSTLMPLVRRRVLEESRQPDQNVVQEQPHRAVAYGAILAADQELGSGRGGVPPLVQSVATCDLGMRVWDQESGQPGVQILIQRNSPLPASHTSVFYTTRPDQTRLVFELVQSKTGEEEASSLGNFSFGPIVAPRRNYPVEVTIEYDLDGLVHVTARDPRTGNAMEHRVEDRSRADASELEKARELVMSRAVNP